MKAAPAVDMAPPSRAAQRAGIALLACLVVSVTILFSGINRPLWIDEVLHFAFGAYGSTQDAWREIMRTIGGINFNTTGVYLLVDYWLLKAFGASAIWLRMPSSIGALVLFTGAICVLRTRGLGYAWQVAVVLSLVAQPNLIFFVGEARPYMLLAATCVGVLAYYGADDVHRQYWFIRVLGWFSALVGAAIHPYFLPYYGFVVGLTYADRISWDFRRIAAKDVWQHLQPAVLLSTLAIYFGLGMLTWMPRQPQLAFDPFEHIPRDAVLDNMIFSHFAFLFGGAYPAKSLAATLMTLAALGAGLITILALVRSNCRHLLSPLALIVGALLLAGLVSLMSYRANYWILHRQWVASIALVSVGTVWLCAAGAEFLPAMGRRAAGIAVLIFLAFRAEATVAAQFHAIDRWRAEQSMIALNAGHLNFEKLFDELKPMGDPADNPDWEVVANLNVMMGDAVWPIFRRFYANQPR